MFDCFWNKSGRSAFDLIVGKYSYDFGTQEVTYGETIGYTCLTGTTCGGTSVLGP